MALSAQCRRVRQRQAPPASQAAIWITDMMLCQAIEQYQRRSLVTNRTLASNRGPLESRRRPLGKRHMADIMASPDPYRPTWWFELMGNKNAWEWQPPTTSKFRRDREKEMNFGGAVDKFMKWLEASNLDEPFLWPPADTSLDSRVAQPTTNSAPLSPQVTRQEHGLMNEIASMRQDVLAMKKLKASELDKALGRCCRALRSRLHSGEFTVEQVAAALEPWEPKAVESRLTEQQLRIISRFTSTTIIATVGALRRLSGGDLYEDAWTAIVGKVLSMEPGDGKFRLFRYMMDQASPADIKNIPDAKLAGIIQEFVCEHGDSLSIRSSYYSTWIKRVGLFSNAVDQLSETRFKAILPQIEEVAWSEQRTRDQRFTWLLVRAYRRVLGHYDSDHLANMAIELRGSDATMRNLELYELTLARMVAEGVLDLETVLAETKTRHEHYGSKWTVLAHTILQRGGTPYLKYLIGWVRRVRQLQQFTGAILWTQVAPGTDERTVCMARSITQKMIEHRDFLRGGAVMVKFNAMAKALKVPYDQTAGVEQRRTLKGGFLELLEWLAYWYMVTPHRSDRDAQRGVEWCMKTYEKMKPRGTPGSIRILTVLVQVMTRDLANGQLGRTERLTFLIEKIEQYEGASKAKDGLKTLRSWRRLIRNQSDNR